MNALERGARSPFHQQEAAMECPYIDEGHPKCEATMRVEHLVFVMTVCGNDFERCPIYQEQLARQRQAERPRVQLRPCA